MYTETLELRKRQFKGEYEESEDHGQDLNDGCRYDDADEDFIAVGGLQSSGGTKRAVHKVPEELAID